MGQMLIRNLEEDVLLRLKAKAKASGISLEELARITLRKEAAPSKEEVWAEIDRLRALSKPSGFDSTEVVRHWRDHGRDGD